LHTFAYKLANLSVLICKPWQVGFSPHIHQGAMVLKSS